jgi:acyl-coenzyme A thioesterase PaaI-like protein
VTLQATTQFLGVAHHEDLECVARPVKIGKSITFVDAEISAGGNPVARGSFVFKTTRSGGAPAGGTSEQR